MKKALFVIFMFCGILNAQESKNSFVQGISLKVQSQLSANFFNGTIFTLNGIVPAFMYQSRKGIIHQLNISGLGLGNSKVENSRFNSFFLSGAYEISIPIGLFQNKEKLRPYLGMGIGSESRSSVINPASSVQFRRAYSSYTASLYLKPSLEHLINERLFMDFSLLLPIGELTTQRDNTENPALPLSQQQTSSTEGRFHMFQQYGLRFGFGVRL